MNKKFKILEKYLHAVRQLSSIKKLGSIYSEGTIELTGTGLSGKYREWKKFFPSYMLNKTDIDLGMVRKTQIFDGKVVWEQDSNGKVTNATTKERLKEYKLNFLLEKFDFVNPDSKYFTVSYEDGKTHYVFTIRNNINETKIEYFINKKTYLLDKKVEHKKDNTEITIYKNYKDVYGVKLPFEISMETPELEIKEKIKIHKYDLKNFSTIVFAPPKKDVKDFQFLRGNRAENIHFEFSGGHIYLKVKVNGKKGNFILDSGAGSSLIDNEFIKSLGVKRQGNIKAQGVSGSTDISFSKVKSIIIDNINLNDQTLITAELSSVFKKATGASVDGLLGFDFLSRFITKIDFAKQLLSCYDPEIFKYKGKGKKIKAELEDNIFSVPVTIENKYSGLAAVDTGAKGISIFFHFVKKNKLENRKGLISITGGLGALHKAKTVRFKDIKIGSFKIYDPLMNFSIDPVKGVFSSKSKIGNLGTNLFRHFIIYLDYKNNILILEKGADFNKKFPENRSGVQFKYGKRKQVIVRYVSPDSPAEESGLKEDDNVISISGKKLSDFQNIIEIGEFIAGLMGNKVEVIIKRHNKISALTLDLHD